MKLRCGFSRTAKGDVTSSSPCHYPSPLPYFMHFACPPPCQHWEWGCLPLGPCGPPVSPARRQEWPRPCKRRSRAQFSCVDQAVPALGIVLSASAVYRIRCRNGLWEPGGNTSQLQAHIAAMLQILNAECEVLLPISASMA